MTARKRELDAIEAGPYARRLGLRVLTASERETAVEMPFRTELLNRGGRVHGGAITSVLLAAGRLAAAVSERNGPPRFAWCFAASVSFLGVPAEGVVTARAAVLRRGRDLAHVGVDASDASGTPVATAALTCVFRSDGDAASGSRVVLGRDDGELASTGTIAASPYLSAAGVELLEPAGRVARLRLPSAPNLAENPRRIDDGAIAGLVDSCAAFASYLDDGESFDRSGVTVSMSLNLHEAVPEELLGRAWVVSRSGSCRIARVEVGGATSGCLAASGAAVYRITAS